jgi:hypothetical protein
VKYAKWKHRWNNCQKRKTRERTSSQFPSRVTGCVQDGIASASSSPPSTVGYIATLDLLSRCSSRLVTGGLAFDFDFGLGLELGFTRDCVALGVFLLVDDDGGGEGEEEAEVDPGEVPRLLLNDEGGADCVVAAGLGEEAGGTELDGSDFDLVERGGICDGVVAAAVGVEVLL